MITYGLTKDDLENCKNKIKLQKDYLTNNILITKNGQVKSLLDLSFSANHSYRYYSQLANKINTLENIAFNDNLKPIFLTITLDGFYRRLIKGNYYRFNSFRSEKREDIYKSVPEDEMRGFIRSKMRNNETLTIKDLYNILNYQMRQFRSGTAFKKLKKNNDKYIYVKTVEPHKDGVPHFHMLLFVPESYIEVFHKDFKRFFVAPRNKKDVSFQTNVKSASAYIMKYITKTFMDIKKGKDLDYMNAWFVKHRIMRCVTSRSILPQWVYQKCAIFEKDWWHLTDILNSPNNHSEWSKEHNSFWIYDTWLNREIEYIRGRLSIYSSDILIHRAGEVQPLHKKQIVYEKMPKLREKKKDYIPVFQDNKLTYLYKDGKFKKYKKHITQMSDYELIDYYYVYDVDNANEVQYTHYLATRNLMITRGLLNGQIQNLSSFKFDEFCLSV